MPPVSGTGVVKPVLGAARGDPLGEHGGHLLGGARLQRGQRVLARVLRRDGRVAGRVGGELGEDGVGGGLVGHGDVAERDLGEALAGLLVPRLQGGVVQPLGLAVGLGDLLADQLLAHVLEDVLPADALVGELRVDLVGVVLAEQLLDAGPDVVVVDLDVVALARPRRRPPPAPAGRGPGG